MRYRWRKKDRLWRRRGVRAAARRYGAGGIHGGGMVRTALLGALALEAAVGAGQELERRGVCLDVVREEETCQVEWIVPDTDTAGVVENRYGMRFQPKTWEVQFYHRIQKMLIN
ncbi:MAG: hypothetical protein PHV18_11595 [Lachnospiraceae bacterium]|nr:hypothetical protein [Lachnospiraceae bacterium]